MKNNFVNKLFIATMLLVVVSCTKLDEGPLLYDKVTGDKFGGTDLELSAAVGAAYSNLRNVGGNGNLFALNGVSTDEIVVPTRGPDWGDGGHWVRLKRHQWKADDPMPGGAWGFCYGGVSTCNRLIATLQGINSPSAAKYIAELKVLRALYYYWLLDWFGNVPLSIDFKNVDPPKNATQAQVYAFIESELTTNGALLAKPASVPDVASYGRVNYYAAQAILAKLYLNAKTYTGTEQNAKALAAANTIINAGVYKLSPTYAENFIQNNAGAKETILGVPFDRIKLGGFNVHMMTLSYLNQTTYNINAQPWNGFASTSEFYNSYIDPALNPGPTGTVVGLDPKGTPTAGTDDKRMRNNFLVGPQFSSAGERLVDNGAEPADPDGKPFTFTPYVNELEPNAWRQSGARLAKWQFVLGMTSELDNDFAIFRYTDILLVKAEATARIAGNWSDPAALAIVNQIRTTHGGVAEWTSMTADQFLAERGRELAFEGWRRQDLIRFGSFQAKRLFQDEGAATKNLYPIPATQLNANKNLTQNPGY